MADSVRQKLQEIRDSLLSKSPHRYEYAAELASDLHTLCTEQVTEADLAFCSAVLFEKDKSVIQLLHDLAPVEESVGCKDELLQLLCDYVKNLEKRVFPYAVEIKDVCVSLFARDKSAKVKNATFSLLIAVLELCDHSAQPQLAAALDVPKLIDRYFKAALQPTKHSATVRCGIYHLLGVLSEQFPEHMVSFADRLVDIYIRTLKSEMISKKGRKPDMPVIAGCLQGLAGHLTNFTQSTAENSIYAQDIYKFSKMSIDPEMTLSRYDVPRAGLRLISKHAPQFKEYLTKDYQSMYESLTSWSTHSNRELKKLGTSALEAYLQQVSVCISECVVRDRSSCALIYQDLMKKFRAIIDNPESQHKQVAVAIRGYGYFARPCKQFGSEHDLHFMFGEMIQRSEQLYLTPLVSVGDDRLFYLPTFLDSLSSIVHEIDKLPDSFVVSLEKMVVLLFEYFPHMMAGSKHHACSALLKLIMAVAEHPASQQAFLSRAVLQGVIRTCSHPVVIEAGDESVTVSVQPDSTDGLYTARQPAYTDYIPLWTNLMDPSKLKIMSLSMEAHELKPRVQALLYNEFIQSVLAVTRKLNLSSLAADMVVNESGEKQKEHVTSDPELALQPAVPKDFQIFINLVDLCRKVLPTVTPERFGPWVHTFGREMITLSSRLPLVSGFYKLLATVLTVCKDIDYFKDVCIVGTDFLPTQTEKMDIDDKRLECLLLFRKFTREVLARIQQYKDELLAACLQLLLSLPCELVELEISHLFPALKVALEIGLSYFPLASKVLNALELWSKELSTELLRPHLAEIFPLLDDYLKISTQSGKYDSSVSSNRVAVSSRDSHGRRMSAKALAQWKEGIERADDKMKSLRYQIMFLLGSLGGQVTSGMVDSTSMDERCRLKAVAWDTSRHLDFAIPFPDMKPSVFLDPFLPRVCELALSSSDRQTKVAACEFLHAVVLFALGKSAQPSMRQKSSMTMLFNKVFPVMLKLACDVERVAEQLFKPLLLQMIHWFTKNTQYESNDTMALLDAILEGMEHPTNTALRDLSAQCVREFLQWSIKQTTKKQQEISPINTKSLLKRLYSMATHPSAYKRLGAMLAFNSIYTVFREEEALVNMFVIEMLVVVINSLKMAHRDDENAGTVDQCCQAIGHLVRIIRAKTQLLSKRSPTRRVPRGMKSAELANLVTWLLSECGSPENKARQQCMRTFTVLAPPATKVANTMVWIRKTLESEGGGYFVSRFEKGSAGYGGILQHPVLDLGEAHSLTEAIQWLESLNAALDCYHWVLYEQFLSPGELFSASRPSQLFHSVEFFLSHLSLRGIDVVIRQDSSSDVFTPREEEMYGGFRCKVSMAVLDLATVLLEKHTSQAFTEVPTSFWNQELYELVLAAVFTPFLLGVHVGDVTMLSSIHCKAVAVLKAMKNHLLPLHMESLVTLFVSKLSKGQPLSFVDHIPSHLQDLSREQAQWERLAHGHTLLLETELLPAILNGMGIDSDSLVHQLWGCLLSSIGPSLSTDGVGMCGLVNPTQKAMGNALLKLALGLLNGVSDLLKHIINPSGVAAERGMSLYLTYSSLINDYLSNNLKDIITQLVKMLSIHGQAVLAILNGLLDHVQKDKDLSRSCGEFISTQLLDQWSCLTSWWEERASEDLWLSAISLLRRMLVLRPKLLQEGGHVEVGHVVDMYCTLLEDKTTSLTFKGKVLENISSLLVVSEAVEKKIISSMNCMVSQQFPLKSWEFPVGSPMFNEYISVIDRMLDALVSSGSLEMMMVLVSLLFREKKHVHEESIQSSLGKFAARLSVKKAVAALSKSLEIVTDEHGYPTDARRAVGERVCLTLTQECSTQALEEFFIAHITTIMSTVESKLSRGPELAVESQLVARLCCYQLLEVLYSRLPSSALSSKESKINAAYCNGTVEAGNELTKAITKAGHSAKSEDLKRDCTLRELRRQYHCYAFNMLMAVISCTQTKPQFFQVFLFKEDLQKGTILWDNIIDAEKAYSFTAELEAPLKRKKQMMAIRDEVLAAQGSREGSPTSSPLFWPAQYISSQYLADSSLSGDVSLYDFSAGTSTSMAGLTLSPADDPKESSYLVTEEQLEQDELNTHECMTPLMKLLDHMDHNKISPEPPKGSSPSEMPAWMASIHNKLADAGTEKNVRLFIARLITNRPKIFQPYAKFWLPELARLVIVGDHGGEGLHYFVVDVLVTMLSWSSTAVLQDQYLANRLLEYCASHCSHDNRSVFRNNLEITRMLVEMWKEHLQTPTKIIYEWLSNTDKSSKSNRTGIQLLGISVANGLPSYDIASAGSDLSKQRFYSALVFNLSNKYKEIYGASAEVLGMVYSQMKEKKDTCSDELRDEISEELRKLSDLSTRAEDRFITCLHRMKIHSITERFVEKLLFMLPTMSGPFRGMCLEVLTSQADLRPQFYLELKDKGFHSMLSHRDEATQLASLSIVHGMLKNLSTDDLLQLIPLVAKFGSHSSIQCRLSMYNILIAVYNTLCPPEVPDTRLEGMDTGSEGLLTLIKKQLLRGLSDDAEELRMKLYEFWNQESNLVSTTLGRLTQLLATLYSTDTENHFLHHSTNLLLELTSRSPDYTRSMFNTPLSECKFEDYKTINLSWQQRHLQMTPLFAATQLTQTQADFSGIGTGMVRATQQSMAFTPTQDAGGYNWMAPTAQSLDPSLAVFTTGSLPTQSSSASSSDAQSSLLFTMKPPKQPLRIRSSTGGDQKVPAADEERDSVMKLKRRFLKSREATSSFFAKFESRKRMMREEQRRQQKAARSSLVVMYRKYRDGEFPDIQIKHSDLIRPLQALAQRDSILARALFSNLYGAIFSEIKHMTDVEVETTREAVQEGLNAVLQSSTHFFPPFIGSVQDICFNEHHLELNPSAVSTASLISMQEPIGIMLLEKQLIVNVDSTAQKSAKRARGASAQLSESTETWVELARLYKSLGEYDILRGIFSNLEGTKDITRQALEAEERGDYMDALKLYKEAIRQEHWSDGEPTQVEEDLWDDSHLNCLSHLTDWPELEKSAVVNIDDDHQPPKLSKVWENNYYQEHYLPFIIRSKLKLLCSGRQEKNGLEAFVDVSLGNRQHREILESRFPEELVLLSVVRDDMDRAYYYHHLCLQRFLQDWSNLSDLLVKSRFNRLQVLQKISEVEEFFALMPQMGKLEDPKAVTSLLSKWDSRYPHQRLDPVSLWDDILTTRCMMMRKITEKSVFTEDSESIDVGEQLMECHGDLQKLVAKKYIKLYMKLADTAQIQSNHYVATKYLRLAEVAIQEHFPNDDHLHIEWLHGTTRLKLHQAEQDPSPSRADSLVSLNSHLGGAKDCSALLQNKCLLSQHQLLNSKVVLVMAEMFGTDEDGDMALSCLPSSSAKLLYQYAGSSSSALTAREISESLWKISLSLLNSSIKSGTRKNPATGRAEPPIEGILEMAMFCNKVLRAKEDGDAHTGLDTKEFPCVVVNHTLKAMQLGSQVASQFFPRLLQLVEEFPESMDVFRKRSEEVPCWMFINWINQMVALLDKREGPAIHSILDRISLAYPQALVYPFKISSSGFKFDSTPQGKANKEVVERLEKRLHSPLVEDFIAALEQLNSPELAWKDYCDTEMKPLLQDPLAVKRNKEAILRTWSNLHKQLLDDANQSDASSGSLYGTPSLQKGPKQRRFAQNYVKKMEQKFGKDGSKILNMSVTQFVSNVNELYDPMRSDLKKQEGNGYLKEYSPWLETFQPTNYTETLEIPGQYQGNSKPLPEHHVKISGFDSKLKVMSSLRKPKRLTILGDDSREYMFLVKGGEDIRLDQRVEQLFVVMNGILLEDSCCSQRGLRLRTYAVIPMTPRIGLIEWMKNTKPLKDFLIDSLMDDEKKNYNNGLLWHNQWMQKNFKGVRPQHYMEMYKKASATDVEKEYRRRISTVPWDLMRRAFMNLSTCPEAFLTLRAQFIKTHATLSICQYILGIGDRHLSNFMVDLYTGGSVAIDFGHAFGTATQFLPIPELMPFRLTPQIVNLLLPHKESGQLRSCMTHTMRALQSKPTMLLNTMDVFIKEPSLEWKNFAQKQAAQQKRDRSSPNDSVNDGDCSWYPKEKVKLARKKLQGYNSARLMLIDLKRGHENKSEFQHIQKVLLGGRGERLRSQVGEKCSSVEEQVACLIDHAMDPNILGRAYSGWEAWV